MDRRRSHDIALSLGWAMVVSGGGLAYALRSWPFILLTVSGLLMLLAVVLHRAWIDREPRVYRGLGLRIDGAEFGKDGGVRIRLYTGRPIRRGLCVITDQEVSDVTAIMRQRQRDGLYSTEVPGVPAGRSALVYATNLDDVTMTVYRTQVDIELKTALPLRWAYVRRATGGDYKKLEAMPSANKFKP